MRKKKLTLIVVPEAHKTVRRFQTSRTMMLAICSIIISLLTAFFLWLGWTKRSYDGTIEQLAGRLSHEAQSHQDEIYARDETIEALQQEVILLTEQTDEVRAKLADLRQLEQEIQELTGVRIPDTEHNKDLPEVQAAGGSFQQATEEEILTLADSTGLSLIALSESLTTMTGRLERLIDELEYLEYIASITPSIRPTEGGRVTSGFGYRVDPFTRRSAFHSGIDIDGKLNAQIFATANGVVEETGTNGELGNYIVIDHSRGLKTVYGHLNRILVEASDHVDKGELIGLMGSTGRSTGTHLHYEVHKDGSPVNPSLYIQD